MILVAKPHFPPLEEYTRLLEEIWASGQITNHGPLVQRLEREIGKRIGAPHFLFVTNGTIALQIALRALGVEGEVITTPFSYVATTSAILWERCTPVFVDVEPRTFGIDATKIEAAIGPRTRAIMATHVYGYPCDVHAIERIAQKHGLKVIYDGAHSFDTFVDGTPVVRFGDVTTLSFHATKLFHTVEGGGMVVRDAEVARLATLQRSFGHVGDDHRTLGINGKASEVHAAMGLCMLPRVTSLIARRRAIAELYDGLLAGAPITLPPRREGHNYGYYPILFADEARMQAARAAFADASIGVRRYFFPSLNRLPYVAPSSCPVSEDLARRVLCLPMHAELSDTDVHRVSDVLLAALRGARA